MTFSELQTYVSDETLRAIEWISSPGFYTQLAIVFTGLVLAYVLYAAIRKHVPLFRNAPHTGPMLNVQQNIYAASKLLFPLLAIIFAGICIEISRLIVDQSALVRLAQGIAILYMLNSVIKQFVTHPLMVLMLRWGVLPIATLHVFGLLDDVNSLLNNVYVEVGNIRIASSTVIRVIVFGSVLFWLGRISSNAGKQIIRAQNSLELGTREVFAKLFEVFLYSLVFILLLNVMGINLTALAVFGGALGVGIGFGLQAIASNFISGIIILLDRSISVGDYIELEDGRTGTIRELNMRSTLLETWDGKDIMVPNEQFITSSFTNWTHKDPKQRYSLNFSVAYNTNIHQLVDIVKAVVSAHPQVIAGDTVPFEELPDCEICGFGDSGIDMQVEWWMEGIDDGKNRVGGDLLLMILDALREHNIEIPFPQREVRILNRDQGLNTES